MSSRPDVSLTEIGHAAPTATMFGIAMCLIYYKNAEKVDIIYKGRITMEELYQLIEEKIKKSGYPGEIDGEEFYWDVSDEADSQKNGTYLFLIKKTDTLSYKGVMTIMDEEFDLHSVDIHDGDKVYHVDFDA